MTVPEKPPRPAVFILLMGTAGLVSGLCWGLISPPFTEIWSPLSLRYTYVAGWTFLAFQVGHKALEGAVLALVLIRIRSSLGRLFAFCVFGGLTALLLWFIEIRMTNDYLLRHAEAWNLSWRWEDAAIKALRSLPVNLLLVAGAEWLPFRANTLGRGLGLFLALGSIHGVALASVLYDVGVTTFALVLAVSTLHFVLFYAALRRRPAVTALPPPPLEERDLAAESHLRALAFSFMGSMALGAGFLAWTIHSSWVSWRGYSPTFSQVVLGWVESSPWMLVPLTLGWVGWPLWRRSGRVLAAAVALILAAAQIRAIYRQDYHSQESVLYAAGLIWAVAMLGFLLDPRAARICTDSYRELRNRLPAKLPSLFGDPFLLLPGAGLAAYVLLVFTVAWAFG